jgi:hypothetical protein
VRRRRRKRPKSPPLTSPPGMVYLRGKFRPADLIEADSRQRMEWMDGLPKEVRMALKETSVVFWQKTIDRWVRELGPEKAAKKVKAKRVSEPAFVPNKWGDM